MRSIITSLVLLPFLGACTDNNTQCQPNCDDTSADHTTGFVSATVTFPLADGRVAVNSTVNFDNNSFATLDSNGDPTVTELLTGDYTVTIGDVDNTTTYGLPIQFLDDGTQWIATSQSVTIPEGTASEAQSLSIHADRYFQGDYTCEYDEYDYDASAPDYKGESEEHVELNGLHAVEVQKSDEEHDSLWMKVVSSAPTSSFGAHGDYIKVQDNSLQMMPLENERGFISTSSITQTEFSFSYVRTQFDSVHDLNCQQ